METETILDRIQAIAYDLYDDVDSRYHQEVQMQWELALNRWREDGNYAHDDIKECLQQIKILKKIVLLERGINQIINKQ